MQRIGFSQFAIRLNHRALLRALIQHAGIELARESDAIVAIDKLDKIGPDGVARELEARGIAADTQQRLLAILGERADLDHLERELRDHAEGARAIAELREVLALSRLTPAAEHMRFDVTLARGLGYYTGSIFEIQVTDLGSSLGGGGRYDGLIGMFLGRDVPACGFTVGLERILFVMEEREMYPASLAQVDVVLGAASDAKLADALRLSIELRRAGLRVDLRPDALKPGKLRKHADDHGIAAAVWIEAEHDGLCSVWTRDGQHMHKDVAPARAIELLSGLRGAP
jgi:histidyl-tRNA synthetase